MTEFRIKFRYLKRWLAHRWCHLHGHYWWLDEQGVRCARCGTPGW